MPDPYILLPTLLLPTGLFCIVYAFFTKTKYNKIPLFTAGIILLSNPTLIWIGDILKSVKILNLGLSLPLSLLFVFLFFWQIFIYKSCTLAIQATCTRLIKSTGRHNRPISTPEFRYCLNGEIITSRSIVSDYTVALEWRFLKGRTYTIYINPKEPTICKHEQHLPKRTYGLLVLGILGLLVSLAFLLFL